MVDHDDSAGSLLARYVAAGDRKDFAGMRELLDERVLTHSPGGTTSTGVEALQRSWVAAHEGLRELRHDVQELLDAGQSAAARLVVTGVHSGPFLGLAATGAAVRVDQALFIRVGSGRITQMWEVVDTGEGLRQLGALGDQPLSPGQ